MARIPTSLHPGTPQKGNGESVPTWNYAVVHAYGYVRVVDDASWLRAHLEALTNHNESSFSEPWAVSDARTSLRKTH